MNYLTCLPYGYPIKDNNLYLWKYFLYRKGVVALDRIKYSLNPSAKYSLKNAFKLFSFNECEK